VPYLVLASLVLYVAYIIRGNDFMLFTPYYWFHNYLDTFDLIFIIIQFLVAFLIGLSIFGATGFSYDRYAMSLTKALHIVAILKLNVLILMSVALNFI
jgi:hypothetical protein